MKKLENKKTKIQIKEETGNTTSAKYSDLIKIVCNNPVQGGYSISDISIRSKIIDSCTKANGFIELEDSQVEYLKSITKISKWGFIHQDIELFAEDIEKEFKKI